MARLLRPVINLGNAKRIAKREQIQEARTKTTKHIFFGIDWEKPNKTTNK